MHLTWQTGDPVIQLNFPNPLNASVQVGDVAYFSNPIEVGHAQEWTATTTPHLSNPQSGIIMIGEITQIIPWSGTVSSIICNMPQDLFNQYFAEIVTSECPPCSICTGDCGYRISIPVQPNPTNNIAWGGVGIMIKWFFDNPTANVDDYKLHRLKQGQSSGCEVIPCEPCYVPGCFKYYHKQNTITLVNMTSGSPVNIVFKTANDIMNHLVITYPNGGFFMGMTSQQVVQQLSSSVFWTAYPQFNVPPPGGSLLLYIAYGGGPVNGDCTPDLNTPPCTDQGSFIMFSKDNKANMSDMLGYYASVELRNNSTTEAELFNVGTAFFESSK